MEALILSYASAEPLPIGHEGFDCLGVIAKQAKSSVAIRAQKAAPLTGDVIVIDSQTQHAPLSALLGTRQPTADGAASSLVRHKCLVFGWPHSSSSDPSELSRALLAVVGVSRADAAAWTDSITPIWSADPLVLRHNHIVTNGTA
jgi:hypothetical protein